MFECDITHGRSGSTVNAVTDMVLNAAPSLRCSGSTVNAVTDMVLNAAPSLTLSYTAINEIATFTAVDENDRCNNNGI